MSKALNTPSTVLFYPAALNMADSNRILPSGEYYIFDANALSSGPDKFPVFVMPDDNESPDRQVWVSRTPRNPTKVRIMFPPTLAIESLTQIAPILVHLPVTQ